MTDFVVRALRSEELRPAVNLFRETLHSPVPTDEGWKLSERLFQPGRALGAFDSELIGTARSFDVEMAVPGGRRVAMAAVTGAGVRPDRTRRGVLSGLMRAQFDDFLARGVPVATLHPTESAIYGRFGYGVSTLAKNCSIDRRRAQLRPDLPAGGEISLLKLDDAVGQWPALREAVTGSNTDRPGLINRPSYCWAGYEIVARRFTENVVTVVHRDEDGVTGLAAYRVARSDAQQLSTLEVFFFDAASPNAFAGLWRYLLSVDLVDRIVITERPLDEPVELLFTDPGHCAVTEVSDEVWMRLVDVETALNGRGYAGPPVVLEVVDPVLEHNSGRYRVSGDGAVHTDEKAQLRLGVDTLAMLYLGTWRAWALVETGRVEAINPAALDRADALFGTRRAAWCGSFF